MRRIASKFLYTGLGTLAMLWAATGAAQPASYPSRPVTIVVPYGAGSSTDILTRVLAKQLAGELGQNVVVENRAGAGGALGSAFVAKAPPDGYTLVMGTISSHSINASLLKDQPFNVMRDFKPISLVAYFPNLLAVNKDLPVNNLQELVAYAKARGSLSYATGGVGSSGQMAGELLKLSTGAPLSHVPYKEVGQGITDTIAGHVPLIFYQAPALVPHIRDGKLKAIAVLAPERTPLLPDVATPAEQGVAGFDASAWMGLFAPASTPDAVIAKIHRSLVDAARDAGMARQFGAQGFTLAVDTPEAFRRFVEADIAKWAKVIQTTGATAQ